jgi:hypothetical protein
MVVVAIQTINGLCMEVNPGSASAREQSSASLRRSVLTTCRVANRQQMPRFYARFWTEQLDALDAVLRGEDAEAAISSRKKGANS